jgi:alcohol dehydrogenase (nicotinoprotein)
MSICGPGTAPGKLDELITRRYRLDEINQGYQDLDDGKIIRGVILHAD